MNAPFSQETRPGRLTCDLGEDALVLTGFQGEERLNGLFDFEVSCLAATAGVEFDRLIGTHATVHIATLQGGEQAFDGIVTEARWTGPSDQGDGYRLRLQPWLFLASLRRNQRIFHRKTVVQILEELLAAYANAGQFEMRLEADYPELEYTVQYRESDLAFACRMMERHGISYHFEHVPDSHLMVISDDPLRHGQIGARPYRAHGGHHQREIGHLRSWSPARRITTGAIKVTDFNFKTPNAMMELERDGDAAHPQGGIESYDYPGDYLETGRGKLVADLRIAAERGQSERYSAEGDVVSLRAGSRMTLEGDPVPGHGLEYLCLAASHRFTANAYRSGGGSSEEAYAGAYLLMPSDRPMTPERETPLAEVKGPQTGTVVGEGEIDCDEFGRILVHLHWDLEKSYTMRCRVSQSWSGNGWGGMVIPRIGMEVVVEFLEGDPDKPLVTGCVYNGKTAVPYPLPEHKTRSTFKTDTHQGRGFNELRFEDKADNEEIFLHAQKDRNSKIENNQSERVNVNKVESVGRNKASEIGNNYLQLVDGDMMLRVGPSNSGGVTPTGASREPEGLKVTPYLYGKTGEAPLGTGDLKISVQATKTQTIGADHNEHVTGEKRSQVDQSYTAKVRKRIELEAGDEIVLVCGKSKIRLLDDGTIEVNGQKILGLGDALIQLQSDIIKLN